MDKDGNIIDNSNNPGNDSEKNENVEVTGVEQQYNSKEIAGVPHEQKYNNNKIARV